MSDLVDLYDASLGEHWGEFHEIGTQFSDCPIDHAIVMIAQNPHIDENDLKFSYDHNNNRLYFRSLEFAGEDNHEEMTALFDTDELDDFLRCGMVWAVEFGEEVSYIEI